MRIFEYRRQFVLSTSEHTSNGYSEILNIAPNERKGADENILQKEPRCGEQLLLLLIIILLIRSESNGRDAQLPPEVSHKL